MRTFKNVVLDDEKIREINPNKKRLKTIINVAIGTACVYVGYAIGYKLSTMHTSKGFELVFEKDPTLKEHIVNATTDFMKDKMLQSK